VPTFPNATHLMTETDFEFWDPANNPDIAGSVNENSFEDSLAPVHAAGQVQLWEGAFEVADRGDSFVIKGRAQPGHLPTGARPHITASYTSRKRLNQ
jgi:hypothetical protein